MLIFLDTITISVCTCSHKSYNTLLTISNDHLFFSLDINDYVSKLELNIDEMKDLLSTAPYSLDTDTLSGVSIIGHYTAEIF